MLTKMEVCIDSVESAANAKFGGAARVELCANLVEGGTTPSIGMLRVVKRKVGPDFPVFVMIRPRGGDFLYDEWEFEVMKTDLSALKDAGADGFVIGALKSDGSVDMEKCGELIALACSHPVTFHRAIDMSVDLTQALEDVISLGCKRVLTSGGETSALEGANTIRKMIEQARGRITVVPGGGITERNLPRILQATSAKEFHASARMSVPSKMTHQRTGLSMGASFSPPEFSMKVADREKIHYIVEIAKNSK